MAYVDVEDARRIATQVVAASARLPDTGFPQDDRGRAALRARAIGQVLEAISDEMKWSGLGQDGRVPADIVMLDEMRNLVDRTIADLTLAARRER